MSDLSVSDLAAKVFAEQRTEDGALLRAALGRVTIPTGKTGQLVMVATKDGVEFGAAVLTRYGWTLETHVRAAVRGGKLADPTVTLGVSW